MGLSYTTAILYVTELKQSDAAATCPMLGIYTILGVKDLGLGSLQTERN